MLQLSKPTILGSHPYLPVHPSLFQGTSPHQLSFFDIFKESVVVSGHVPAPVIEFWVFTLRVVVVFGFQRNLDDWRLFFLVFLPGIKITSVFNLETCLLSLATLRLSTWLGDAPTSRGGELPTRAKLVLVGVKTLSYLTAGKKTKNVLIYTVLVCDTPPRGV